jgi:hypothetical protein
MTWNEAHLESTAKLGMFKQLKPLATYAGKITLQK